MKNESPDRSNNDELKSLLFQFQSLKYGKSHVFLDEEDFEKIIDHYDDIDDIAQALEAAEWGVEQHPYSSTLLIKKADLFIATRRYQDAMDILNHVELLDSFDINIYILKTDIYLALDQQDKAVALLEKVLNQFEGADRIELLFELADVYDDYEKFDKIFDCLRIILEEDPTNEEALYKICFWTDFTKRNEESIRLHQQIIDEHPYSSLAWFNLAAAYQGLKLYEKSIDAYKYAVVIDEKFDYAYRNMGDAFIRLRKYKDAIEVLEKVLELSRPEDVIFEALGYCYDRLKNYAQARFYYRKASHLNPEDVRVFYKIALTYMNEGLWTQGVKNLETALLSKPSHPDYNLAIGDCYIQLGRFKEAVEHFLIAISVRPKSVKTWEALLFCLYKGGFYEEVLDQVALALLKTGNKPVMLIYATLAEWEKGSVKNALLHLEQALTLNPKLRQKILQLNPAIVHQPAIAEVLNRFGKR